MTPRCCCLLASSLMVFPQHFWDWWRINSVSFQYLGEKIRRQTIHNDQPATDLFVTFWSSFEYNRHNLQEIWEKKESTSIRVALCVCYISFHIYSNSTRVSKSKRENIKLNKTMIPILECVQINRCCITHFS